MAAVLARDAEEVQRIRAIFAEWVSAKPAAEPPPPVQRKLRTWHIAAAALLLLASAIAAGVWIRHEQEQRRQQRQTEKVKDVAPPPVQTATSETDRPAKPPPALPDPPYESVRQRPWIAWAAAAVLAMLALLALALRRTRAKQKHWTRRYWRHVLAHQPGPHHYEHKVPDPAPRLERRDIEEAATILGRAMETDPTDGDVLDVEESLRRTLQAGLAPHLVFQPPPRAVPVLVLQDLSWHMRPWQRGIDRFLAELIRQGVSLDRWYFDGDPMFVSRTPHGHPIALESLALGHAEASLLIVSSGQGIDADSLLALDRLLEKWMFRTWIHPVVNPKYWRRELASLQAVNLWPMTRAGVRAASVEISRKGDAGVPARMTAPPAVTRGDVERMKQLIALVPHPSLELAEALRRRFAPDVPEDVVLFLGAEGVFYGETLAIPPAEWKRLLDAASLDPAREREVREYLLGVLQASQPAEGSTAHLRWELDTAMHRLKLGDTEAMTTLRRLAEGPLRDEVQAAVAVNAVELRVDAGLPGTFPTPPPDRPPLWRWPHPAHAVLAVVAIAAVALLTRGKGTVEQGDPIPHQRGAYTLEYFDDVNGFGLRLGGSAGLPTRVDLYRDGQRWVDKVDATLMLQGATWGDEGRGAWFDVRAVLPRGNLATSHPVWVPLRTEARPTDWIDDEVSRRVIKAIAEKQLIPESSVRPGMSLSALTRNKDELSIALFIVDIGRTFDFELFYGDVAHLKTVADVANYIRAAVRNREGVPVVLTFVNAEGAALDDQLFTMFDQRYQSIVAKSGERVFVKPGTYNVFVSPSQRVGSIEVVAGQPLEREFVVRPASPWNDPVSKRVVAIIVRTLKVPEERVTPETLLVKVLGGKSVEIVTDAISDEFPDVSFSELPPNPRVGELVNYVRRFLDMRVRVLLSFVSPAGTSLGPLEYTLTDRYGTRIRGRGDQPTSAAPRLYILSVRVPARQQAQTEADVNLGTFYVPARTSYTQKFEVPSPEPPATRRVLQLYDPKGSLDQHEWVDEGNGTWTAKTIPAFADLWQTRTLKVADPSAVVRGEQGVIVQDGSRAANEYFIPNAGKMILMRNVSSKEWTDYLAIRPPAAAN